MEVERKCESCGRPLDPRQRRWCKACSADAFDAQKRAASKRRTERRRQKRCQLDFMVQGTRR